MDIEEKLLWSKFLLRELAEQIEKLDATEEELIEIHLRSTHARLKMKMLYMDTEGPPELFEQIQILDSIIKELERKQTNLGKE